MSPLILLVEDETDLLDSLDWSLRREGFATRLARDGATARVALAQDPLPDLVVLDLMLPDDSGLEICRRIRRDARTKDVPVLMLTARGTEADRVVGFEVGADDYVVKPFSNRELVLRLRAILRRAEPPEEAPRVTTFGRLKLDEDAHRAWVDDEEIELTALEFKLLATFLARRGRAQNREVLLADVWGIRADVTTRTVDTHVKRLRQRLGPVAHYVETLRGVGYRFTDDPSRPAPEGGA